MQPGEITTDERELIPTGAGLLELLELLKDMSHDVFISHSSADWLLENAAAHVRNRISYRVFVQPGNIGAQSRPDYVLHLTRTQTGTLKATNGTYTLTSGLLSTQGNYRFEGSEQFVDTQGKTTSIWKRQ